MPFEVVKFRFELLTQSRISLPSYKGSTFRGGFGHAFKKVVCVVPHRDCSRCLLRTGCVYSYVFETLAVEKRGLVPPMAEAPHPFVIEPPEEEREIFEVEDPFRMNLILIGKAVDYLPYFIYTLERLGEIGLGKGRGKYQVRSVVNDTTGQRIYDGESKLLASGFPKLDFSHFLRKSEEYGDVGRIRMVFHTPARVRYRERLATELEFHVIVRSLLRRITNLDRLHCGGELDFNHTRLIQRAEGVRKVSSGLRWYDWERYSSRQGARMRLGGLVGEVEFEGELAQFLPYLFLGELVHLGKGTSFGLGRYEVKIIRGEQK